MGLFNKEREPQEVTIKDKPLTCSHCGHYLFLAEDASAFYRTDIFKKRVTCFVCADCGHIHWFAGAL